MKVVKNDIYVMGTYSHSVFDVYKHGVLLYNGLTRQKAENIVDECRITRGTKTGFVGGLNCLTN